ncbi:hypothetical protein Agub_g13584, partial [Astrephomene gubernaculifera]
YVLLNMLNLRCKPPTLFVGRNCSQHKSLARPVVCCWALEKRRSFYELLGVAQTATIEDIRAAYRSLAKSLHPDVSQEEDAEAVFAEINKAYEVLSDEDERGKYDYIWRCEQQLQAAADSPAAEGASSLSPEEELFKRSAVLQQLQAAQREAQRARQLARMARKAAEEARRQAAEQAREARARANNAAAAAPQPGAADNCSMGPAGAYEVGGSPRPDEASANEPGVSKAGCRAAKSIARQEAREAAREARRQAREARRHASQVRSWAQWAEQEVEAAQQAAGLEPQPPPAAGAAAPPRYDYHVNYHHRRRAGATQQPPEEAEEAPWEQQ